MKVVFIGADTRKLRRAAMSIAQLVPDMAYSIVNAKTLDAKNPPKGDKFVFDGLAPDLVKLFPGAVDIETAIAEAAKAKQAEIAKATAEKAKPTPPKNPKKDDTASK